MIEYCTTGAGRPFISARDFLARGSEYLPDAQAGRELYSMGKSQAMSMPAIASASLHYESRAHMLSISEKPSYGTKKDIGYDTMAKPLASLTGYLSSQTEIDKLRGYLQ